MSPEKLARKFHEIYERLAPGFDYKTRKASAVPWASVPEKNRKLMIAVADELLTWIFTRYKEPPAPGCSPGSDNSDKGECSKKDLRDLILADTSIGLAGLQSGHKDLAEKAFKNIQDEVKEYAQGKLKIDVEKLMGHSSDMQMCHTCHTWHAQGTMCQNCFK